MDFDLVTQLAIIAHEARHEFQIVLMYACVIGLVCAAAFFFASKFLTPSLNAIRAYFEKTRIEQFVVGALVVCFSFYGATKVHISYDVGLKEGTTPNSVTNNLVHITWQKDTSRGIILPDAATVYIDYRTSETTNDWELLCESTVSMGGVSMILQNATSYDYNVWAYYIPPEPIHTNGVWVYKTVKDTGSKNALPLRARIEWNGKAISTPKQKREDEQ